MNLERTIRKRVVRRLIATQKGRAYVLNLILSGEEADEAGVFDRLAALAPDEAGRSTARRHQADEEQHAALYRACLARTGIAPRPVPDRLKLTRRVVRSAPDSFATRIHAGSADGIETREDLMNTYAILLVVEKRAVKQFPLFSQLFREAGDVETAEVFDRVVADEARHVKYCHAMGQRYATDEATWDRAVARFARLEIDAYRGLGLAMIGDALAHDLLGFGRPGRALGWLLSTLEGARVGLRRCST